MGDCYQWKTNGQCSKGDSCCFSHDPSDWKQKRSETRGTIVFSCTSKRRCRVTENISFVEREVRFRAGNFPWRHVKSTLVVSNDSVHTQHAFSLIVPDHLSVLTHHRCGRSANGSRLKRKIHGMLWHTVTIFHHGRRSAWWRWLALVVIDLSWVAQEGR